MNFKESKTYRNLRTAYDGELRAVGKYTVYGEKADADELMNVVQVYRETAGNEREHAEQWLDRLNGGEMPSSLENLRDSAAGEFAEWTDMYRRFAQEAAEEGYHEIARQFERVASVERRHNRRFCMLADELGSGMMFCAEEETAWVCMNCGHVHVGRCAPKACPLCGKAQTWFTRLDECD